MWNGRRKTWKEKLQALQDFASGKKSLTELLPPVHYFACYEEEVKGYRVSCEGKAVRNIFNANGGEVHSPEEFIEWKKTLRGEDQLITFEPAKGCEPLNLNKKYPNLPSNAKLPIAFVLGDEPTKPLPNPSTVEPRLTSPIKEDKPKVKQKSKQKETPVDRIERAVEKQLKPYSEHVAFNQFMLENLFG